jgi:hypothetical protein
MSFAVRREERDEHETNLDYLFMRVLDLFCG